MSSLIQGSEAFGRAAVLLALLFMWTLMVVGVSGSIWPGDSRTDQLFRLGLQQIVAVGGLAFFVMSVRGGTYVGPPFRGLFIVVAVFISLAFAIALVPVTDIWAAKVVGAEPPQWWRQVIDLSSFTTASSTILALAVIPPICEECFFREALFREVRALGNRTAIGVQAICFAAYHLDLYGLPSYVFLGFMLGWIRVRLGLAAAIVAHVTNNLCAIAWIAGWISVSADVLPMVSAVCGATGLYVVVATKRRLT